MLAINPWYARNHARRADMLARFERWQEAAEEGEAAIELDPTLTTARQLLVEIYRQAGDGAASQRHAEVLKKMSAR
jgi:DNA-binding SARP family transcriptional activator